MVSWPAVVSSEAPSAWLPVTGRATNAKAANRGIAQNIATGSKSLSGRLGFIVHPFPLTTDKAEMAGEKVLLVLGLARASGSMHLRSERRTGARTGGGRRRLITPARKMLKVVLNYR